MFSTLAQHICLFLYLICTVHLLNVIWLAILHYMTKFVALMTLRLTFEPIFSKMEFVTKLAHMFILYISIGTITIVGLCIYISFSFPLFVLALPLLLMFVILKGLLNPTLSHWNALSVAASAYLLSLWLKALKDTITSCILRSSVSLVSSIILTIESYGLVKLISSFWTIH